MQKIAFKARLKNYDAQDFWNGVHPHIKPMTPIAI
jgi:hypothetical protein